MKRALILLVINLFVFSCGKSGEEDKKMKELEYQLAKKEYELRQQENEIQNPPAKTQTAVIIDKDGWTNVRNAPNMEGVIIDRIYEDEIFEVIPSLNENWWLVKTPNGIEGYMHKSKIKISDAPAINTSDKAPPNGKYTYSVYIAEFGFVTENAASVIIDNDKIKIISIRDDIQGMSYKKGDIIEEGTIMLHKSGVWIIALHKNDVYSEEVGGCSDGPTVIDFNKKQVIVC
ncbi:MAG: SH3 domain-containing protein [Flavobacteriia bacterium]|nr:SH3 domain-containing protein [Flavobacteriia bacterium]